jgi:hypothetical protein
METFFYLVIIVHQFFIKFSLFRFFICLYLFDLLMGNKNIDSVMLLNFERCIGFAGLIICLSKVGWRNTDTRKLK